MKRLASVEVGAVLLAACSRPSPVPAPVETASALRESEDDILDRRIVIRAEIRELGPDHAWAGAYYAGDGLGVNVTLTVAPASGCVATWNGCMGLYGVNYGRVTTTGRELHIAFEQPNTPGAFGHFDCDFTIEGTGASRYLRPPNRRDVLRLVEPE